MSIPFTRLLRVEWRKQLDTRAARWLVIVSAVLTAAAVLVPLLRPSVIPQTFPMYLQIVVFGVTMILPVVSILTVTTEWTRRTVLTTFTQEPRRGRVTAAKFGAGLGLAALAAAVGIAVAAGGLLASDAAGRTVGWDTAPREVVGFVVLVLLNALMALAFGVLLHNTAAAVTLYFVLPMVFSLLSLLLRDAREWVDTAVTFTWVLAGDWAGHTPQILTSLGLWVALPLAVGLVRTARREVS
jgi:hypothetical protein